MTAGSRARLTDETLVVETIYRINQTFIMLTRKVKGIRYQDGTVKAIEQFISFQAAIKDCLKFKGSLVY